MTHELGPFADLIGRAVHLERDWWNMTGLPSVRAPTITITITHIRAAPTRCAPYRLRAPCRKEARDERLVLPLHAVRPRHAAIVTGISAPAVGTYIVQRRLALLGDGLGHVALTGVAVGVLTGTAPLVTAIFCGGRRGNTDRVAARHRTHER